jgi:cobalt-zinc-cadmium resistance protein CzcA
MLDRIILFSIHNKIIIGFLTLMLIVWGIWSLNRLPIDAVPDITNNQVQVITFSPTLSPTEVERLITSPVELELSNMPDLQEIRSLSRFGLSVITAVFSDETDVYKARQLVSERLLAASEKIPSGLGRPEMGPVSTGLGEIFQYTLKPEKGYEGRYDLAELRTLQDWVVRKALLGTPGVADVSSFGGYLKQYEVAIDPKKLRSFGITVSDVYNAIKLNNGNSGGSYIAKGPQAWYIRSEGMVRNLDDLGKISLGLNESGLPLLIRDVAEIRFGHSVRYGALTSGDKGETVGGIVLMLKGENSGEVSLAVREKMKEIESRLPKGLHISVYLDRSDLVDRAVKTVRNNLVEGALIVIFVLVLILGNLRAGLVVASVIPLAMLFAIGMMQLTGVSGNLMSLGAIDFGLIVDGAVIIVEACLHHLMVVGRGRELTRKEMDQEVFHSASKMRNSAAFGELIILIVYLPILALVGIEGKMFGPMAKTVAFAIGGAFLLSITYVPVASALFLSRRQSTEPSFSERMIEKLFHWFSPLLALFLRRRKIVLASCSLLFAFSIWLFLGMGGEFIPALDEGDLAVETRLVPGTSMEKTVDVTLKAAGILQRKFPEVKDVVGKIGTSEIPTDPMPFEACDLMVLLHDKDTWTSGRSKEELIQQMEESLAEIPGVEFGFQQPIQMRFNELMTGAKQDVAIKIYGHNLDSLATTAERLGKLIQGVDGVSDLYIERISGLPEMVAVIDRERIARYGLSVEVVNDAIRTGFAGSVAGQVFEGERRFEIAIRLDSANRQQIEDLRNLTVSTPQGKLIPISELAEVNFRPGPNQIQRDNANRRITVAFNVRGRDVESLVEEINMLAKKKLTLPEGYHYSVGGQFRNLQEAKARLMIAVPAALVLIFLLLFLTFNSAMQALLIFSAIPLSAIGGIFALWLRNMPFSISAGVGFIALFGVAVLNGIVLMAEFNSEAENTHSDSGSLIFSSVRVRFRPVLMTALVASLGFLPMAISTGAGAEVQKPLATVVIGGLFSATILTLLVLPVLYSFTWKNRSGLGKAMAGLLVFLVTVFSGQVQAQSISFSQLFEKAIRNNSTAAAFRLETNAAMAMELSANKFSKASLQVQAGQYNSNLFDQSFNVNQSIPNPAVVKSLRNLYRSQTGEFFIKEEAYKASFGLDLRTAFEQLYFSREKKKLLSSFDSLSLKELEMARLRFQAGETGQLEIALANRQSAELKSRILQAEREEKSLIRQIKLMSLDSSQQEYAVSPWVILNLENDAGSLADSSIQVRVVKAANYVEKAQEEYEKKSKLPEFSIGYFNQSLRGIPLDSRLSNYSDRFQGINFGVIFPILPSSSKAKIASAGLRVKAGEQRERAARIQFQNAISELQVSIGNEGSHLEFLEKTSAPAALQVYEASLQEFRSGKTSIHEQMMALKAYLIVQEEILQSRHNQALLGIQLHYLTIGKWN